MNHELPSAVEMRVLLFAFCIHAHFFAFVITWERDALMWVMEIQGRKQKQIEEESYVLVP